jgi:acyl-CoA synthetase (AMP-forming)/AMP-acid ligase II
MQNTAKNIIDDCSNFNSFTELLQFRAINQASDKAYGFFSDAGEETQSLTYEELHKKSLSLALQLKQSSIQGGERALLLFPPGLEFLVAYFGCIYAGIIPVPVIPSRRGKTRSSTFSILNDAKPKIALTTVDMLDALSTEFKDDKHASNIHWLSVDITEKSTSNIIEKFTPEISHRNDLAFLQYTSGSTSSPKGVMVTHGNLLENSEMIKQGLGNDESCHYVSWVPLYHDMGLIYNVLQSLYLGTSCVLLAPVTFLQRPLLWLKAISHYKAKVAGAPNFAFDLCVERFNPTLMEGIDLSHWEVAFNGAEPVRAETISAFINTFEPYGFKPKAFYPCYGMAEATLLISGGQRCSTSIIKEVSKSGLHKKRALPATNSEDSQHVVGCGKSLIGETIAIVNPDTLAACSVNEVGEIWVSGDNIASGYWENKQASTETFLATIAGVKEKYFLRTGDLGFLDENKELFIAGRLKDVIIVRGENFYPQDIEKTVEDSHPALKPNCCAVFTVQKNDKQQLVIVQEVKRTHRKDLDVDDIIGNVRQAVVKEHELTVGKILLIKTGTITKTSSGKIQRALSRLKMQNNEFEIWGES